MKRPLIFVQDPNALKNWLNACGTDAKVLYDLEDLSNRFNPKSHMVLIQISPSSSIEIIIEIAKQFDVMAFANEPNDSEGLQLFQRGVKGYLNTFSSVERIEQALETINAGSVWLGQSVMQAMIQSLVANNQHKDDWKKLLTEREQEATDLVLQSKSNKQIAQALEITERTVKAHLHNVFEKLEVSDRLGLVLKIKNWP